MFMFAHIKSKYVFLHFETFAPYIANKINIHRLRLPLSILIIMQKNYTFTLSILKSLKETCVWLYLIDVIDTKNLEFLYLPIFNLWIKINISAPPHYTIPLSQTLNWHVLLALYFLQIPKLKNNVMGCHNCIH